ncbi:RND family transporter [Shewanella sp. NIFS-20-20]|uniref:efflux RND transporter permease subunit n=1 Tax=Shewanella sp. NIFS-20-20 TaxID=2853806 RepID=UPI001C437A70|nr:MMPL family transporter [Shewanella sp. NIFS-20-20]MBV7315970.1 MMPL family transporter [Shewanella sp. NIFS-20-20]
MTWIFSLSHRPWLVPIFWLGWLIMMTPGVSQLEINSRYDAYFANGSSDFIANRRFETQFERGDSLWLVLQSEQDWRVKLPLLTAIEQVLSQQTSVTSVLSVAQMLSTTSELPRLPYKGFPRQNSLLSEDGRICLVEITLTQSAANPARLDQSIAALGAAVSHLLPESSQYHWYGPLALNWQYANVLKADLLWFAPSLLLLIILCLYWRMRAFIWVVAIILNIIICSYLTLALAGYLSLTLAAISGFVPVVVVTLLLSGSSHLYLGWARHVRQGGEPKQAMQLSVLEHLKPMLWASVTTALGFALLTLSPSPPIQAFGIMVTFAVLVALALNLSLLLWFSRWAKASQVTTPSAWSVSWAVNACRQPRRYWWLAVIATLAAGGGLTQLTVRDDPLGYFSDDNPLSQAREVLQQQFAGANHIYFQLDSQRPQGLLRPEVVSFTNRFKRFLLNHPQVTSVDTYVDWLKATGVSGQTLTRLLVDSPELSHMLRREIDGQLSTSAITLHLTSTDTASMLALEHDINAWLTTQTLPEQLTLSQALGPQMMFARLSRDNGLNMMMSFAVSALFLMLVVGCLRRSTSLALLALVMNLLPILWVFGLWSVLGGGISLGSAVAVGIIMGIIVDDSLHLLLRLPQQAAQQRRVMNVMLAQITPAISLTSLILVAGFSIGILSDFGPIRDLSLLSALMILAAWWVDLLLLPNLYMRLMRRSSDASSPPLLRSD